MSRKTGSTINDLGRLFSRGTASGLGEQDLLDRFLAEKDEAAFATLVARHGPMVLGVCRRILHNPHQVEDAFQATFLVFVRRAETIRGGESVGRWLHGVARRVATRARAESARRNAREGNAGDGEPASDNGSPEAAAAERELLAVLDEELTRLPATLRSPMILCYLEGLSHDEAASRLGWPVGTVHSRMARARETLRRRLSRRGLTPEGAALVPAIACHPVSSSLLDATVRGALAFTTQQSTASAVASASATALANGVLHAMMISNLKILVATTLACALALGGVRTYALRFAGDGGGPALVAAGPEPRNDDPRPAPPRSVAQLQGELAESTQANAKLQKQLADLRAELKSLRRESRPPALPPVTASNFNYLGGNQAAGGGGSNGGASKPARYIRGMDLIVTTPSKDDVITAYSTSTGKAKSLRLPHAAGTKLEVVPIIGPGIAALHLKGTGITQIAAFGPNDGAWHTQELREPAALASPIIAPGAAAYAIGRRVYAFGAAAKRWDVLELPEGAVARPSIDSTAITCEHDGHLHAFSLQSGTWEDIDLRASPADPAGENAAKSKQR